MRLNRVLLLAASFVCMIFAMVFTISCSGDDGKDGKAGASCTVREKVGGYDVLCGGEVVGELLNGRDGDGSQGGLIPAGACAIQHLTTPVAGWYAVCNGQNGGLVAADNAGGGGITTGEGCRALTPRSTNKHLVVLVCPNNLPVNTAGETQVWMCGGEVFNPAEQTCKTTEVLNVSNITVNANSPFYTWPIVAGVENLYTTTVAKVEDSYCGSVKYDMRTQFCDDSGPTTTKTVRDFCGGSIDPVLKFNDSGKEYRGNGLVWTNGVSSLPSGSANAEKYIYTAWEFCEDNVVKSWCGTAGSATNPPQKFVKATQFCENFTTAKVTDRCGTPNAITGIYMDTLGLEPEGRIIFDGKGVGAPYNKDYGLKLYYNTDNLDGSGGNTNSVYDLRAARNYLWGEYETAKSEQCLNGKTVVKLCGDKTYSEKTQFCAVGDQIGTHCDDRQIYDPSQSFCSHVGNGSFNIPTATPSLQPGGTQQQIDKGLNRLQAGFFNYGLVAGTAITGSTGAIADPAPTTLANGQYRVVCSSKANGNGSCQQYATTAVDFCGVTAGVEAGSYKTFNDVTSQNSWKWEFCRDVGTGATAGTTIVRCAGFELPPVSGIGNTCSCVANSAKTTGANDCTCNEGFVKVEIFATGEYHKNESGFCIPGVKLDGTGEYTELQKADMGLGKLPSERQCPSGYVFKSRAYVGIPGNANANCIQVGSATAGRCGYNATSANSVVADSVALAVVENGALVRKTDFAYCRRDEVVAVTCSDANATANGGTCECNTDFYGPANGTATTCTACPAAGTQQSGDNNATLTAAGQAACNQCSTNYTWDATANSGAGECQFN